MFGGKQVLVCGYGEVSSTIAQGFKLRKTLANQIMFPTGQMEIKDVYCVPSAVNGQDEPNLAL